MGLFSRHKQLKNNLKKGKEVIFLCSFLLLLLSAIQVKAQDPEFSQFYANPIYLNPAFTGTSALPRAVMNYRNQWPKQGNTYTTYNLSIDKFINSTTGGIGIKVMYDRQLNGVINSLNASFIYAEHFNINDQVFFSMALETGFIYKQFNITGLVFPGMINQGNGIITGTYPIPIEGGNKLIPDFSFGTVGQFDEGYFGMALHHLTQPDLAIFNGDQSGKLPLKLTLHAGAKGREFHNGLLSKEFTISPNVVYQQQGDFKQINGGLYLKEDWLTFGLWYRNNLSARPNSMVAMLGYQSDRFQFGYSFDFSLSNTAAYSYGSHEISMIFFFGEYHKRYFNNTMVIPQM
jgi:type IX secretion system PorP/SprF family membrane protein